MKPANRRVQQCLQASGESFEIVILPDAVKTAKLAAEALGCEVSQIANSLIFRNPANDEAVLIMSAGGERVDLEQVKQASGIELVKADADFVRRKSGFAIGGVPPVGHDSVSRTLLDLRLRRHDAVWAAAGTPESVFCMTPEQLEHITRGQWMDVGGQ